MNICIDKHKRKQLPLTLSTVFFIFRFLGFQKYVQYLQNIYINSVFQSVLYKKVIKPKQKCANMDIHKIRKKIKHCQVHVYG